MKLSKMKLFKAFFTVSLVFFLCMNIFPQEVYNIRMGTIAPRGSAWYKALVRLKARWLQLTNGRVRLKIQAGGTAGGERELVEKLESGQLQAAAFTSQGLNYVTPSVLALSVPGLVKNDAELEYLLDKMFPAYKKRFDSAGYRVLEFSIAGWLYFFSRDPVIYPEDLMRQTLIVPGADSNVCDTWRKIGFRVKSVSTTDMLMALKTKMADAFYSTPLYATFDLFKEAKNMSSVRVAPAIGGIIVSNSTWNKIPDSFRKSMLKAAREIIRPLYKETKELDKVSVKMMKRFGLKVFVAPPDAERRWEEKLNEGIPNAIGKSVPLDIYNLIKDYLEDFRKKNGAE